MASAFRQLCDALNEAWTPALRAAGYTAPAEPFSRTTARYEFTRPSPNGRQVIAVLFRRDRQPEFSIQVFVEPPDGMESLQRHGGVLAFGTVAPRRTRWPRAVAKFSVEPSLVARVFRRPPPSPRQVVQSALDLMPEIDSWWQSPRETTHIWMGTARYVGQSAGRI